MNAPVSDYEYLSRELDLVRQENESKKLLLIEHMTELCRMLSSQDLMKVVDFVLAVSEPA